MDSDRPPPPPHRPTTTSDLFICFTSRHHSSSMKLPSKSSILSPGRTGLTTSLSRRLRTNRSIKGAASPAMFPTTGKKKGSGFENPEPSSPKVTCIGQVRIKSKKKHRLRSLSRRHSTGDVSFRKLERKSLNISRSFGSSNERNTSNNNSQRWVHLPLTICEALRAFGSEFSCLFPCRSSCFSPVRERERKMTSEREGGSGPSGPSGSCAAVFTRWMVAFHDGDDSGRGGRRDGELVVQDRDEDGDGDEDEDEEDRMFRAARRHVFDDLEIVNNRIQGSVDEPRVSICIPPKNALLLMRCRSDPLKMEALANRLWESTVGQSDDQGDQDEDFVVEEYEDEMQQEACYLKQYKANDQEHQEMLVEECIYEKEQIPETNDEKDDELTFFGSLFDEMVDQDQENDDSEENAEQVKEFAERSETTVAESKEREELPECLLLMMYEPKLSMEVSKETWVSSKDFIRRQPSRKKPPAPPPAPVKPNAGQSTVITTTTAATATTTTATLPSASKCDKHVLASASAAAAASVQPGRSSCSLPAPSSMAEMLEQKLVNAVGYEPFVLTRCKSEPMRTAAAKLAPDNCFWKNRKLEPLRRASFGVGAAGIGC